MRSLNDDGTPGDWEYLSTLSNNSNYRISDLETPYVDEWNFGFSQSVFSGRFSANYLNRDYNKQLITVIVTDSDDEIYKEWQDSGTKKYEEVSLQWEKQWSNVYVNINATWSDSISNCSSYSESSAITEDELEYVSYNDELMYRTELPADNYARPIKASLTVAANLIRGFSVSASANFKDSYKKLADTNETTEEDEDGYEYAIYDVVSVSSAFTVDSQLSWEKELYNRHHIQLTCDISNLFNSRIDDGNDDDGYLLGRQYWVGLNYKF